MRPEEKEEPKQDDGAEPEEESYADDLARRAEMNAVYGPARTVLRNTYRLKHQKD